ncbi:hypothetical protein V5799_007686 [Amblyomma americanum]|uniref:Uncharacterized protein n=2 Tax=Amblyomma americanum TaxID=6943 RepID=A0AAQ4FH94_AMBAM
MTLRQRTKETNVYKMRSPLRVFSVSAVSELQRRARAVALFANIGPFGDRAEYLKHAPCLGRMSHKNGPCSGKFDKLKELMKTDMDLTHQQNSTLPQLCCYFYSFYNCYRRETKKQCGSEAYALFERYTGYLSSSLLTSSCEKHLNHTECSPVASSTTGGASVSQPHSVLVLLGLFVLLRRDSS